MTAAPKVPPEPLVGAHMSAAGGLAKAVERAVAVGCGALQVFTKNSNQWRGKPISGEEAGAFRAAAKAAALEPLVSHAAYLINLASPDAAIRERSAAALVDELARCETSGIPYLVLHPGSHGGDGEDVGLDRIAKGLDVALEAAGGKTVVLLETAAGQGACLGHAFEQLAAIRRRAAGKRRLAVCFDTCHVHAAGYDVVSKEGWKRTLEELDGTGLLPLVKVVHANDSKKPRGCRVDRHERIGHGFLGEAGFANLMTEPAFAAVPKILETPKDEAGVNDREGLALLRRLARGAAAEGIRGPAAGRRPPRTVRARRS